jgi:monoamine oxidase
MTSFTRRSFLAATAAMTAAPAFGAVQQKTAPLVDPSSGIDVIVVGAGAAGIAAARRIVAAGKSCVVLEATGAIGGRCITDTAIFGMPYDRGARFIHMPESNPVAKLATESGLDIYPAPPGQRVRIMRRYAREGEMEDLLAFTVRANTVIAAAARKADIACAGVLPKELGEWRSTIEFLLGPYHSGSDLAELSTVDLARAAERDVQAYCRQGLGTLVARLAHDLPLRLSTPATRIAWSGRVGVEVETAQGPLDARAAIITVSTGVLSAGKIGFAPELPKRQLDAIGRLRLGSYDHVTLELPGNPLGLRADELVFERAKGTRTASLLANISGTNLCSVDVGGSFGRDLAAQGQAEMIAFARDWLDNLYGTSLKRSVKRSHATNWNAEPWVLGAMSAAAPGGQSARRTLQEPLNNRIWFAGEATHERHWGTVRGAWESGERAAAAVLRTIAPQQQQKQQKQKQQKG